MQKKIVLCEVHFDPIARELIHQNMLFLIQQGFKVFGFEHDEDKSIDFEIESLEFHIRRSPWFNLFSRFENFYPNLCLESNKKLLDVFLLARKNIALGHLKYQGLDAVLGNRFTQTFDELLAKISRITNRERERKMSEHLLRAESGFFIIGASHMPAVQRLLIEKLGEEQTREQFLFIVPFSKFVLNTEMDIRFKMMEMAKSDSNLFFSELCPLKSVLFFNKFPSSKEPHLTADDRFRDVVCAFIGKRYDLPGPSYYSSFIKLLRDCCCPVSDLDDELRPSHSKTL